MLLRKSTLSSEDFYGPYEAQEMGKKHSEELSVKVVDYPNMVYVGLEHGNERGYATDVDAKAKGLKVNKLSGTECFGVKLYIYIIYHKIQDIYNILYCIYHDYEL